MSTLEEMLDSVEAQTTRVEGLITLTNDLHQKVVEAMGSGLTPSQQMRVDAVFKEVTDSASKVDAAITANTPQATAGAVSGGSSYGDIRNRQGGLSDSRTIDPNVSVDPSKVGDPSLIGGTAPSAAGVDPNTGRALNPPV